MENIYNGTSGVQYHIEEKRLAGGGEGSIYQIQGQPQFVAKIFKENRRTIEREQKLLQMIRYKLTPGQLKQVTWPQDVLYDQNGFAGYVMPKLDKTDSLVSIYSNGFDNKYDIRYRVLAAINLCIALKTVHEMGQVCGDLNPQNICINLDMKDRENGFQVTLVDTDSYHLIADNNVLYRCEVGLGDYIAPELQKKMAQGYDLKNVPLPSYTKETDLFALAVHIFALLMNGCHPFACAKETNVTVSDIEQLQETSYRDSVVAPQPIENIKDGFFPFFDKKPGVTTPIYAPAFHYLPEPIQILFIRTFSEGYEDPSKRATEDEWIEALKQVKFVKRECVTQEGEKVHYFFEHNTECPICATQEKFLRKFGGKPPVTPPVISSSSSENRPAWQEFEQVNVPEERKSVLPAILLSLMLILEMISCFFVLEDDSRIVLIIRIIWLSAVLLCIASKKKKAFAVALFFGDWFTFCQGVQLYQNIKKGKTSNPKFWWLTGVVSIAIFHLFNWEQVYWRIRWIGMDGMKSIMNVIWASLVSWPATYLYNALQIALYFAIGHWMAYPYKKNK